MNLHQLSYAVLFLAILIQSCSTGIEKYQIPITNVVEEPESYRGKELLWGGTVTEVVEEQDTILIEVDKKTLDDKGKPIETEITDGKFLSRCSKELKADGKWTGREVTVFGRFKSEFETTSEAVNVVNVNKELPVVNCIAVYLWEENSAKVWSNYRLGNFPPFLDNPNFIFNSLISY